MLEILEVRRPEEKLQFLKHFDVQNQTWLVSDLRTKFEIQSRLFENLEVLEEDSILRASELWRKFLVRTYPDLNLISMDLTKTLLGLWLRQEDGWLHSPGAAESLCAHMQQLLPLIVQSDARSQMQEWFAQNSDAAIRWQSWWELSTQYLAKLIENGVFPASWGQALLIDRDLGSHWQKNIIVDLNVEMTPLEAEVLWQISQSTDVKVLVPHPEWIGNFNPSFQGYFHLYDKIGKERPEFGEVKFPLDKERHAAIRLSSQAAEVKNAVATVRQWLDEGIQPHQVAIVAPEIEDYWPVLRIYLEQEGVAFNKDRVSSLQSYMPFQRWLSRLRLAMQKIDTEDLESHLYSETAPVLAFEKFKVLYTHLFDEQDLARDELILKRYQTRHTPESIFERDEFLQWTLKYLDVDFEGSDLDQIFPPLLNEIPAVLAMPLKDWIFLFESRIAKREVLIQRGDLQGVQVINLSSSEWSSTNKAVLLGLTEEAMKSRESTALTQLDVQKILADLGVVVNPAENYNLEFEALWLMDKKSTTNLVLSTAETDFSGSILSPSLVWLVTASNLLEKPQDLVLPGLTRWDEIKNMPELDWKQLKGASDQIFSRLAQRVDEDLGRAPESNERFSKTLQLSASSLERFAKCPFIFKAEKLFRLSDRPEIDLDLDPMNKGTLIHQVLKQLFEGELKLSYSDAELNETIDRVRSELDFQLVDERFWPSLKAQTLRLVKDFLEDEKQWQNTIKTMATAGTELSFIFYLGDDKQSWQKEEPASASKNTPTTCIRGQIDRVDVLAGGGAGQYLIIDYKSTLGSSHRNWNSWLSNPDEIQLALYALVVESGLTSLEAKEVAGSLYYGLKERSRRKGLVLDNTALSPIMSRFNKIESDKKAKLFEDLNLYIFASIEKIRQGELAPLPIKIELCSQCQWSLQCRAPHLN